jgi:hypothetical protein
LEERDQILDDYLDVEERTIVNTIRLFDLFPATPGLSPWLTARREAVAELRRLTKEFRKRRNS